MMQRFFGGAVLCALAAACPPAPDVGCRTNPDCGVGEVCRDGDCVPFGEGEGDGGVVGEGEGEGDLVGEGEGEGEGEVGGEGEGDGDPGPLRVTSQHISAGARQSRSTTFRARAVVGAPRRASSASFQLTTVQ